MLTATVLTVMTMLVAAPPDYTGQLDSDWLVTPLRRPVTVEKSEDGREVVMDNGLIRRTFRLKPGVATVALDNLMTGESMLRGVKPEARLTIDGIPFNIGGLQGQPDYAYLLDEWKDDLTADPNAWQLLSCMIEKTHAPFPWRRVRHCADLPWPPPGALLAMSYRIPDKTRRALGPDHRHLDKVMVQINYEMYQGIPLMCKWLTIHNGSDRVIRLNSFTSEILAMVEYESHVENYQRWNLPNIHVESDYAYGGMNGLVANRTTFWERDPDYQTQVSYPRENPCLLESRPPIGPDVAILPHQSFLSFRTYELIFDSTERERKGLTMRRMYRTIAPWITENPIMMHVRQADPNSVRLAVDQCAEVGFEMVIMTFGSGFNLENEDPAYLAQMKELADYAHSKGVEIGGYSLLSSRRISDTDDVIDVYTGRPGGAKFGNAPCLGSNWGLNYFRKLYAFYDKTGFDLLEHDGSYPGDTCASTRHPGHQGYEDSQWTQWKTITDFYKWCRGHGVYLNVPDFYYLTGSTKCAMGYRETNWSLPRAQQILHGRQNIYDGTWTKTPSMGWMFVPLTEYHGGGAAATIEPLRDHLDAYEAHLANNFGAGVQACYRGPRLYDCNETKAVVRKWVDFFKRYRDILESDVIHVRRADGRDIDCLLHVNSELKIKGLAMIYNPLDHAVERKLKLPLYYTGLTDTARIREKEGEPKSFQLDRQYNVTVPIRVEPAGVTWLVIE